MSFFGGGGGGPPWPTDYLPGQSPQEKAVRQSGETANAMLQEQRLQRADAEAQTEETRTIAQAAQAKADKEAADQEDTRQQRLRGGGIQRFMTAGYAGYGDSRALGTALTLGG